MSGIRVHLQPLSLSRLYSLVHLVVSTQAHFQYIICPVNSTQRVLHSTQRVFRKHKLELSWVSSMLRAIIESFAASPKAHGFEVSLHRLYCELTLN